MKKKEIFKAVLVAAMLLGVNSYTDENSYATTDTQGESTTKSDVANKPGDASTLSSNANGKNDVGNNANANVNEKNNVDNNANAKVNEKNDVGNSSKNDNGINLEDEEEKKLEEEINVGINRIYKDKNHDTLSDDVTSQMLNDLLAKVAKLKDNAQKNQFNNQIEKAQNLIQQFTFKGLGDWVFASLSYHADNSNFTLLKVNSGQPHSYFNQDYLTIKILDTDGKEIFNRVFNGNQWNQSSSEQLTLKEGYQLQINAKEPGRVQTNHDDELKQNNANDYQYVVKNNRLVRLDNRNRTFKFRGLGDHEFANLNVDYNKKQLELTTLNNAPHVYFNDSYLKIEVLDNNNNVVYTKDFIGNETQSADSQKIPFSDNYKVRLISREPGRIGIFTDRGKEDNTLESKNKDTLFLINSKNIERLNYEKELFKDANNSLLVDNLTQSKINQVAKEIESLPDGEEKQSYQKLIQKAQAELQQFTFKGLADWVFSELYYHADGSDSATLKINSGQPHSYISDSYLKINVKDTQGRNIYSKDMKGNQNYSNTVENIPLKEGFHLEIVKTEPSRFETNHNEDLKQNNVNPYQYVVKNHRLVRINDKNRSIKLRGIGDAEYANIYIDYNSKKLTLNINGIYPHYYFKNAYETVEIYDSRDKLVYKKEFIGNEKLPKEQKQIPFEFGYTIKLISEEPSRVVTYKDNDEQDKDLALKSKEESLIIGMNGINKKFNYTKDMRTVYAKSLENRVGKDALDKFSKENEQQKRFLEWLLNNQEALANYLSGGYASNSKQGDMQSYQYNNQLRSADEVKALKIWSEIWNKYDSSHSGTPLKLGIATSLEFANKVVTWLQGKEIDPIERYRDLSTAYENGILMSDVSSYDVQTMRNIVNAKIANDEVEWLRDYLAKNHPNMLTRSKITTGYSLLTYRGTNPDTGESVQGPNFYGKNPTIREVVKYGGVCGAMSKFSSIVAQLYGVPSLPIGQPGHCAYEYLDENHTYQLGYDVFGWQQTNNYNTTFPFMKVSNELSGSETYKKSEYERFVAMNSEDKRTILQHIDKAISLNPLNYNAWKEKINYLVKLKDNDLLTETIQKAKEQFSEYPVIVKYIIGSSDKK